MALGKKKITKRDMDALETKNKLFNVSLQLFAKYGYDKVTIDDITQYAGVSKGNFYTHFDSKDAVLVEQFREIDDYYTAAFKQVTPDMGTEDKIMLLVRSMCEYCEDICGLDVIKIVYMNQIGLGQRVKILLNQQRAFYNIIRDIVHKGHIQGYFTMKMTEDEIVEFLARACRNHLYEWCLYDGAMNLKESGKTFFECILRCLRADPR